MLKKRIIPCLDIKEGRTVKGVNFEQLRDAGDPIELAQRYCEEGADELVFLDITATVEKRKARAKEIEQIAAGINIPFTVGGGMNSEEDVAMALNSGADKTSLNSAILKDPGLIERLAKRYGSQCVVAAIDINWNGNDWKVFSHGGRIETEWKAADWAKEAMNSGAGEILLTSMQQDGTKAGFELNITDKIAKAVSIPVIASGGAGKQPDFVDLFNKTAASAALAASVFHFGTINILDLKRLLKKEGIAIR